MSGEDIQLDVEQADQGGTATVLDIEAWTASRTFWTRLEPRTRDPSVERPLRAEVHDPAWMLCRQWQVGEFQGEDAGTPVTAELSYANDYLSRYELGGIERSEVFPGADGLDLPIVPSPALDLGGDVPVGRERTELDAVIAALETHRDQQSDGAGGNASTAQTAFETYLHPGPGETPLARKHALAYLATALPDDDGGTSTFAERATAYLASQSAGETTIGGDSVGDLVTELVAYAEGSASWSPAATTFAVLVGAGTASTTTHLVRVLALAHEVLSAYETAQTDGTASSTANESEGDGGEEESSVVGDARDYAGEPLEVLVEREATTAALPDDDAPPARLRADAGQTYLRYLADADVTPSADGATYGAADLVDDTANDPEQFLLDPPEDALAAPDRRFASLTAGRAVDGHAVYRAFVTTVPGIRRADGFEAPSWPSNAPDLPIPTGESLTDGVKRAATGFVEWYADLYDEPATEANPAWQDDRQEHQFSVATGPSEGETVLKAEEYPGGDLDWYAFDVATNPLDSLSPPSANDPERTLTAATTRDVTLSKLRYRGMPASRWWEFEDAAVNLDAIPAGPEELSKLLLLDFSLVHGDDWFLVPLDVPIGTLTRITDLTVTDTFGVTTDIDPVTANTETWNAFAFTDLPASVTESGEPGLFLPPTLSESQSSDAVERVAFTRDEMANLAFAVEERVESPVGSIQDRAEFQAPKLVVDRVVAGPDATDERVVLRNTGDAPLDVTDWTVEVTVGTTKTDAQTTEIHAFSTTDDGDPVTLDADASVIVHTGDAPPDGEVDGHVYLGGLDDVAGVSAPVWDQQAGSVVVRRSGDGTPSERHVARRVVTHDPVDLPSYALASSVPDHYYALKPRRPKTGPEADPRERDTYELALAHLLDADAMGDPLKRLPTPRGRILDTPDPLFLKEEEVTRAGRDVERHYQHARWTDGSTHLWSSRRTTTGSGEIASQLTYDDLDEPDADDTTAGSNR